MYKPEQIKNSSLLNIKNKFRPFFINSSRKILNKKFITTLSAILFILSIFLPARAEEVSKFGKYKREKVSELEESNPKEKLAHEIKDFIYFEKQGAERKISFSRKAKEMRKQKLLNTEPYESEAEKNKFVVQIDRDLIKIPDSSKPFGYNFKYENKNRLKIIKLGQYGLVNDELFVFSGYQGTIAGIGPLNIDKNNNIYVLVEGYKSNREDDAYTTDMLERFIDIFNEKGELTDEIPLERHGIISQAFTPKQNAQITKYDISITDDGSIYIKKENKESIEIYKWNK